MYQFKVWITTRRGFERFEFVLAKSEEEVRRGMEGTLESREKIRCIEKIV